jgi:hypothetical protein
VLKRVRSEDRGGAIWPARDIQGSRLL